MFVGVAGSNLQTDVDHYVIHVSLKSGEVFVLDIAGAQYGFHDYVIPLADYLTSRVVRIKKREGSGSARAQLMTRIRRSADSPNPQSLVWALDCQYALAMENKLKEWEEIHDQKFDEMFGLPEHQYLAMREEFLIFLHSGLVDRREALVAEGTIRFSEEGITYATDESWKLKEGIPISFPAIP